MKNLEDIFTAELKNLYALEKQIQETMNSLSEVPHKKLGKRISQFRELNSEHYDKIQSLLQKHSINPGNTTDSIAGEILLNISEIDSGTLKPMIKDAGLLASIYRLASYKASNYEIAYSLAKASKMKKVRKKLKKLRNASRKHKSTFSNLTKKSVFRDAT